MTYTVATRPVGSISQFTPLKWQAFGPQNMRVGKFRLMSLSDAQIVAQQLRAAGHDAVAFNMAGV